MADQVTQKVINEIIALDKTSAAFQAISGKFNKTDKQAKTLKSSISSAFSVAGGMLLSKGITAVSASLREGIQNARDFSTAMAEVSTLVDTTTVDSTLIRLRHSPRCRISLPSVASQALRNQSTCLPQ